MKEALAFQAQLKTIPSTCCLNVEESLLKAAWIDNFRGIRGLLFCPDANINVVDKKGRTPLYVASWLNNKNVVKVLLDYKEINVDKGKMIDGLNPFAIASEKGHFKIMERLIHYTNINEGAGWDSDSWTQHGTRDRVILEATAAHTTHEITTKTGVNSG